MNRAARRQALAATLSAYFDIQRLSALSAAYVYGAALPSLVLWVHAGHPLPRLVTLTAALVWAACAAMAGFCAVAAWRRHEQLAVALPERVVRVRFTPDSGWPSVSALLIHLCALASVLLWLNVVSPGLVSPNTLKLSASGWLLLLAAALGNRWLEHLL